MIWRLTLFGLYATIENNHNGDVIAINRNLKGDRMMKKQTQIILCIVFLLIGLLTFTLQVFVFEAADGILGFLLCLLSISFVAGSTVKFFTLSKKWRDSLFDTLDFLFSIR